MILRERPLVLVSSTIREFEIPRAEIESSIRELNVADGWLFEFHAVSTGAPAELQYLNAARSCDLLVLIVGSEMSIPTQNEYLEGFADNPDKVLAFYVGPSGDQVAEFRSLIDSRHARTQLADASDLAKAISDAVEAAVANGRVTLPSLRRRLIERLDQADRLLDLDPPLALVPYVVDPTTEQRSRLHELWGRIPHIALTDIGGAGKTYASLAALFALSEDRSRMPIYVRAETALTEIVELIVREFDAVRFQPGVEHIERFGREGLIAVCVDGIDQLDSDTRADLLASVNEFAERFPRVHVLVPTRAIAPELLPSFVRVSMAFLTDEALVALFELNGQPGLVVDRDVPQEIVELARRPFFAGVLATTGLDAATGLVVLQRLIEKRLRAVVLDDQRRIKLRFVLGELARNARPAVTMSLTRAYGIIANALATEELARRFSTSSAETLIDRARTTGLADVDRDQLQLVHPLVATLLAAEATALRDELPRELGSDRELAAFVAALLPETREEEIVTSLAGTDIFTLARTLRLRPTAPRTSRLDEDAARYAFARSQFETLHSDASHQRGFSFITQPGDSWLCVRARAEAGVEVLSSMGNFEQWVSPGHDGSTEFTVWPDNPFEQRLPALVAAADAVMGFKSSAYQALAIDRSDEFQSMIEPEHDLSNLDLDDMRAELIAFFRAYRDACVTLAHTAGLDASSEISVPSGEPKVHLWERAANDLWVQVIWSTEQASVGDPTEARIDGPAYSLDRLGDPTLRAKNELTSQIERALGSPLDSSSSLRPELLAAWVW